MKRLLKSWVFWAFVAPPVLGALSLGVIWDVDSAVCACGSERTERAWRFGLQEVGSIPITPSIGSEMPSPLFREVLHAVHTHAWKKIEGATRSLRGAHSGYSEFAWRQRPFGDCYREAPLFQAWLKREIERGAVTPAAVETELAGTPSYPPGKFPFGWMPP